MPLNIRNKRVSRLAADLAAETGESITNAVGQAVEEKLARLRRRSERNGLAARLMEIGRECSSNLPAEWLTRDFDLELFDERGLPK
ncbi:MAG: type II toxin-antitoxin system VapB family antitoxin [Bryobacteraceae bacterium]